MAKFTAKINISISVLYPIWKYLLATLQGNKEKCVRIIDEMVDKDLISFKESKKSDGK